jgi:hypothetical protein
MQAKEMLEYLAGAQHERQQESEHLAAQTAAVNKKNRALQSEVSTLENLLRGALAQDTYIDLEDLKTTPRIPAFDRTKPVLGSYLPAQPSGLALLLPWKRKAYEGQYSSGKSRYTKDRREYDAALREHQWQAGRQRAEAEGHNEEIERYQRDFAAREPKAVEEYFALVLEKSAYPAGFPQERALAYLAETKQLAIRYRLPAVDVIPKAKRYKYDKLRDEIKQTVMSPKRRRRLYASALAQISLRTIHEVFTADRTNVVERIAFEGYVDATDPGSGQPGRFCLVDFAIDRRQFDALNLDSVEPRRCLQGLRARISSKPDQLLAVDRLAHDDQREAMDAGGTDIGYYKERISKLEGTIQTQGNQIREMESRLEEQRDRIAELAPELREEQARNAELQGEILRQASTIAELKHRNTRAKGENGTLDDKQPDDLSDTQATDAHAEVPAESDFAEAELFAPILSETADDSAVGARIPPHEPGAQANILLAPHPEYLEIMSIILQASQHGQLVDGNQGGLSDYHVDRLLQEGILERSAIDDFRLRPSQAGEAWFHKHNQRQQLPERDIKPSSAGEAYDAAAKPKRLGELLGGEAASSVEAGLLQRPAGTPVDLLTDLDELVTIMGEYGSETSRLIEKMAEHNWSCDHDVLEAIFKQDEQFTFVNNIIDKINDRANEKVEHPLIIEENEQWIIDEEFRDEIEHILNHPEYVSNS